MIEPKTIEIALPIPLLANLNDQSVADILRDIADGAYREWSRLASQELHTTRQAYIAGIVEPAYGPGMATISLVGDLPNVIEQGMPETDLRTTLLGPNAKGRKQAKEGHYYRAIPFRHATPTNAPTMGQNVGIMMGKAYSGIVADAKKLGRDVYRKAKRLAPSVGKPGDTTKWGKRLAERVGGAPLLKSHHATDIYAGMARMEKVYGSKATGAVVTQSQYMTFRTISEKVTVGWIRPATEGKHLAEKVADYVAEIAPAAVTAYVDGLTAPGALPPGQGVNK